MRPGEGGARRRGFTLLEVMVAIAILTLGLTALFAGQGVSIKVAHSARKTTVASLLARCKMGEIEERVAEEGMPAIELGETDGCCEGGEIEGFECEWKVERLVLPEMGLDEDLEVGEDGEGVAGGGGIDLAGLDLSGGGSGAIEQMMGGGGEGDAMAEMAMGYAYPILRPAIEEAVRRATVTVRWHEGERPYSFDVVQYLVSDSGVTGLVGSEGDEGEMPAPPPGAMPGVSVPGVRTP